MTTCHVFATLAAILVSTTALAGETKRPPQIEALIKAEQVEQDACSDGIPRNLGTEKHCATRDDFDRKLESAGWCYGKQGEYQHQMDWHKCGPNSLGKVNANAIEQAERWHQLEEEDSHDPDCAHHPQIGACTETATDAEREADSAKRSKTVTAGQKDARLQDFKDCMDDNPDVVLTECNSRSPLMRSVGIPRSCYLVRDFSTLINDVCKPQADAYIAACKKAEPNRLCGNDLQWLTVLSR